MHCRCCLHCQSNIPQAPFDPVRPRALCNRCSLSQPDCPLCLLTTSDPVPLAGIQICGTLSLWVSACGHPLLAFVQPGSRPSLQTRSSTSSIHTPVLIWCVASLHLVFSLFNPIHIRYYSISRPQTTFSSRCLADPVHVCFPCPYAFYAADCTRP